MINVGVFGYGTVGSGVVEVLTKNAEIIKRNVGDDVKVKAILDLREFPGDPFEKLVVHEVEAIVNDPEIDIVCETMGGATYAYKYTKMALEAGKSVCTSNKELVALHGPELIELAKAHNCSYKFEASTGGGIPIIRALESSVTADHILSVVGIVNGTTNYMLTKMTYEGSDFDEVLKEAQALGYAELHPEADIEGHDAARKIAILASVVCGKTVDFSKVPTEGITNITARDIKYAEQLKMKIKLLAKYEDRPTGAFALVAPYLVKKGNPLYNVDDVYNAILVRGNMLDDAMFMGRGAGKLPTASAVCGDVVECAKNNGKHIPCNWIDEEINLPGYQASKKVFFVRVGAELKQDAINAFGGEVTEVDAGFFDEYAFMTCELSEADFASKKAKMGTTLNYLRVEK
ncbi:MAG: homoserine dehydrogenase [Lachnospiraceae bacterium]|nr:homoserine dehydrogenase [Lachnospiraceae bacterium]